MIGIEFGIIPSIDKTKIYTYDEAQEYNCVTIDDDLYINDWWNELQKMNTYFNDLTVSAKGLNRHGITLIPPTSLSLFENIVQNDLRIELDVNLKQLLKIIQIAKVQNKFMIHYGI